MRGLFLKEIVIRDKLIRDCFCVWKPAASGLEVRCDQFK